MLHSRGVLFNYQLYITKNLEKNELPADEQNGFRSKRSCIDHIFSLITILRNRKAQGKASFVSFIDYKKAFDSVDRNLLLFKLSRLGIVGEVYGAIKSLYRNPKSRVILNSYCTDCFQCPIGVSQGDVLSPTLFAIYINNLVAEFQLDFRWFVAYCTQTILFY